MSPFHIPGEEHRSWKGSSSEDIAAVVGQHAPPPQLQDWALFGPPRNLQELDTRELRETAKWSVALKQSLWCVRGVWAVIGITPLILPWPNGLAVAALWSPLAVGCHLMYRHMVRKAAEHRREYERERQQLAEK
jgi:hypothetical protein